MLKEQGQTMGKSFIIYPNHIPYKIWQNFLVILAFYTSIVSSFVFVFLEQPQAPIFNILDYIVNSFFCFDIALSFFVAYYHKDTLVLVTNPKHTALHYLKSWFVFDVICNLPPIFAGMLHAPHLAHAMFLLLQLFWRFGKILTFFNRLEMDTRFGFVQVRIAKLTWIWLFNMHLGGCIIYTIASTYGSESLWMKQAMDETLWGSYLNSIYLFEFTTTFARPIPFLQATPLDMMFIILFKVVNMGFVMYVIANGIN